MHRPRGSVTVRVDVSPMQKCPRVRRDAQRVRARVRQNSICPPTSRTREAKHRGGDKLRAIDLVVIEMRRMAVSRVVSVGSAKTTRHSRSRLRVHVAREGHQALGCCRARPRGRFRFRCPAARRATFASVQRQPKTENPSTRTMCGSTAKRVRCTRQLPTNLGSRNRLLVDLGERADARARWLHFRTGSAAVL